jgi:hypothetical protein
VLRRRGPSTLLALFALAATARARADEPQRTRVVIRGTGQNVTIERTPSAERRIPNRQAASPVIGEAARLAVTGAGDEAVIAYLRRHQLDLPAVVEASDVRLLRKAGAGGPVLLYLEAVAAVDLGELGEGREGSQAPAPPQEEMASLEANGYPAYPFYGGYGTSYIPVRRALRAAARFPHRPVFRHPAPTPFSSRGSFGAGRRRPW